MTAAVEPGWERRSPARAEEYLALVRVALGEARALRNGNTDTLVELLEEQERHAERGELPWRQGGFALTRFLGEWEWGAEGERVLDLAYRLQELARERGE